MATTVAGTTTYFESDGKAVNVTLTTTVAKGAVIYAEGWLGIAGSDGESDDVIACIVDDREYQFEVPTGLTVNGEYPDDEAYTTTAGAGKRAFFKATADKDANDIVTGIMIAHNALLS
jgi:hypothetical protein